MLAVTRSTASASPDSRASNVRTAAQYSNRCRPLLPATKCLVHRWQTGRVSGSPRKSPPAGTKSPGRRQGRTCRRMPTGATTHACNHSTATIAPWHTRSFGAHRVARAAPEAGIGHLGPAILHRRQVRSPRRGQLDRQWRTPSVAGRFSTVTAYGHQTKSDRTSACPVDKQLDKVVGRRGDNGAPRGRSPANLIAFGGLSSGSSTSDRNVTANSNYCGTRVQQMLTMVQHQQQFRVQLKN